METMAAQGMPRRFYFRNNADMSSAAYFSKSINSSLYTSIAYSLCIRVIATVITWVEALAFVSGMSRRLPTAVSSSKPGISKRQASSSQKNGNAGHSIYKMQNIHQFLQVLRAVKLRAISIICPRYAKSDNPEWRLPPANKVSALPFNIDKSVCVPLKCHEEWRH